MLIFLPVYLSQAIHFTFWHKDIKKKTILSVHLYLLSICQIYSQIMFHTEDKLITMSRNGFSGACVLSTYLVIMSPLFQNQHHKKCKESKTEGRKEERMEGRKERYSMLNLVFKSTRCSSPEQYLMAILLDLPCFSE